MLPVMLSHMIKIERLSCANREIFLSSMIHLDHHFYPLFYNFFIYGNYKKFLQRKLWRWGAGSYRITNIFRGSFGWYGWSFSSCEWMDTLCEQDRQRMNLLMVREASATLWRNRKDRGAEVLTIQDIYKRSTGIFWTDRRKIDHRNDQRNRGGYIVWMVQFTEWATR